MISSALSVVRYLNHSFLGQNSVVQTVVRKINIETIESRLNRFVRFVEKNLNIMNIQDIFQEEGPKSVVQDHVLLNGENRNVVYNLTTDAHVYYANGILVSNCDSVSQAIFNMQQRHGKLPSIPKLPIAVANKDLEKLENPSGKRRVQMRPPTTHISVPKVTIPVPRKVA